MAILTQVTPKRYEEHFEGRDRDEIKRIIADLRDTYVERLHIAQRDYHQKVREANQMSHEVSRLQKHLDRMEEFCKKHNIDIEK